MCVTILLYINCFLATCVEFEFSEYTALESAGLLEVTLLLLGREQLVSFNVTVIAYNDESSSSAIGNGLIGIIYVYTYTLGNDYFRNILCM